ncbi:MAG: hypothetical protein HOP06_09415 [Methylotenera sp.]|nr:hypothetical protein [Methylotenera sp.]
MKFFALVLLSTIILTACEPKTSEHEVKVQKDDAKLQVEKSEIEIKARASSKLNELQKKIADGAPDLQIQILALEISNNFPGTPEALQATELAIPAEMRLKAADEEVIKQREANDEAEKKADEAEKKANEKLFKKMSTSFNKEVNKVEDIKFYHHKSFRSSYKTSISPYIAASLDASSDSHLLRFMFMYYGSDWLFVKKLEVKCGGERFTIPFEYSEVKRDNGGGDVREWVDMPATTEQMGLLRCAANTENEVFYNIEGNDYRKEVTMSKKQQEAIKETLYLDEHYAEIGMK